MSFNKTSVEMVIETEQKEWLETIANEYSMKDISKAVRVLLDYAIEADSDNEIFNSIRCRFCS
ncbi:MAG: hypothetical protein MK000_08365 [Anaerolineales bacterium]|nr:hypothetical protein [Anaerolineales bacterium]